MVVPGRGMSEPEKVLRDPVYGYVYIHDPLIWDVLAAKEVQRLRRIRQLGTAYLTYPGGEHSRFSHALGTYEVVRRMVQTFSRAEPGFSPERARLAMAAGLLHDVGHGPFSHSLEHLWGASHEQWGANLIMDPSTDVNQALAAHDPDLPQQVADVLLKRHPDRLVSSLVSGQLDADRLDYLRRDALFCGVDYGQFNLDRILRVVHPLDGRLVVKSTGVRTVEAYLLARYFMYWQVYFHPVCRSADVLLRQLMARARWVSAHHEVPPAPPALGAWLAGQPLTVSTYLELDDHELMAAWQLWQHASDPVLADLAARLRDRRLFRYAEVGEHWDDQATRHLRTAVATAGFDPTYYLVWDEPSAVYYEYYPSDDDGTGGSEPLFVWDGTALAELSQRSAAVAALAHERAGVRRIFYPEEVEAAMSGGLAGRGMGTS